MSAAPAPEVVERPRPATTATSGFAIADYPRVAWPALARTAGRFPRSRFYDDLARLVSDDALDADGLLEAARRGSVPPGIRLDVRGLGWFAHVTASRAETGTAASDTAHLFALSHGRWGDRTLNRSHDTIWVQALQLAGRLPEHVSALTGSSADPEVWWAAETDRLHPRHTEAGDASAEVSTWLSSLNRPLTDLGLEPYRLRPGPGPAFDRLVGAAEPLPTRPDQPLISVVVPVYNPGPSLGATVQALLDQTWPALEILLCDDASSSGTDLIAELADRDPRVRVLRLPRNAGTYAARNLGLGEARGEYVTFNDADDISHVRRLERQLQALGDSAGGRACLSRSIRLTEDLHLTVIGRPPTRLNLSSVLFRRADVLGHLGGFDTVRKGGDSEFLARFTTVFGPESLVEVAEPLALVQLTAGSLSRDDWRLLRTHPARQRYQSAFRHWHRYLESDPTVAYVAPGTRAPFPAPDYITGAHHGARTPARDLDVLLLASSSPAAPTVPDLAAEAGALAAAGLRVGVLDHLAPYDLTERVQIAVGDVAELVHRGDLEMVLPGERVHTRLVVVRDPASVQAMPAESLDPVRAEQALVVADYHPAGGDHYDAAAVDSQVGQATGAEVRWLPATSGIAAELADASAGQVLEPALFGCLRHRWPRQRHDRRLRVGVSFGAVARLSAAELAAVMVALLPPREEVVVWGSGRHLVPASPRPILHLDPAEVSLTQFLGQVDVLVAADVPGRGAHLDRVVLAALGQGVVPVLPASWREHFGEAALYLEEHDTGGRTAQTCVDRLRDELDLRPALLERGAALLRSGLSAATLQRHIIQTIGIEPGRDRP